MCISFYNVHCCNCLKLTNTVPCRLLWLGQECVMKTNYVDISTLCNSWGYSKMWK